MAVIALIVLNIKSFQKRKIYGKCFFVCFLFQFIYLWWQEKFSLSIRKSAEEKLTKNFPLVLRERQRLFFVEGFCAHALTVAHDMNCQTVEGFRRKFFFEREENANKERGKLSVLVFTNKKKVLLTSFILCQSFCLKFFLFRPKY